MNPDLRSLIALQDTDQKIAALQKQIADIPSKKQTFQEELELLRRTHEEHVARRQTLTKRRRTHEGEVEMMETRLAKLKDQLMSVKTNKEYTAMLHEIQLAEEQIRSEEDKILDIMEESENLQVTLREEEKESAARGATLEAEIRKLEESVPGMESEVAAVLEEKARLEQMVQEELLLQYRRIAAARKGLALAEAREELCSVCHVRIRPQVYAELQRSETIYRCDSCDRILFYREVL